MRADFRDVTINLLPRDIYFFETLAILAPRVTFISDLRDNYVDNYFRAGVTFSCGSRDIYFDFGKPPVLTCFGVPFGCHFWSTG